MEKNKVIVYSTQSCPYCHMAKDYFKSNGVEFTDYNVATDQEKAQEMVVKSGQMGVPVIEINGEIIIGFQPNVFQRLLNK